MFLARCQRHVPGAGARWDLARRSGDLVVARTRTLPLLVHCSARRTAAVHRLDAVRRSVQLFAWRPRDHHQRVLPRAQQRVATTSTDVPPQQSWPIQGQALLWSCMKRAKMDVATLASWRMQPRLRITFSARLGIHTGQLGMPTTRRCTVLAAQGSRMQYVDQVVARHAGAMTCATSGVTQIVAALLQSDVTRHVHSYVATSMRRPEVVTKRVSTSVGRAHPMRRAGLAHSPASHTYAMMAVRRL